MKKILIAIWRFFLARSMDNSASLEENHHLTDFIREKYTNSRCASAGENTNLDDFLKNGMGIKMALLGGA